MTPTPTRLAQGFYWQDLKVGAEFETAHAIGLFTAGCQHHDGRGGRARLLPDGLTHKQAVHAGQHQIEQDEIWAPLQRLPHAARRRDVIVLSFSIN